MQMHATLTRLFVPLSRPTTNGRAHTVVKVALVLCCAMLAYTPDGRAQDWQTGVNSNTTTIVPRRTNGIRLVALLNDGGQRIDKGIIWRVYSVTKEGGSETLITESRQASPTVNLKNGRYIVNASFGRAHLTKEITITGDNAPAEERFVLNAGGLRVKALLEAGSASDVSGVRYDIFTDRDQLDNRQLILSNVKPGVIIRLNSGIYHIVSRYGDANAKVESDITVEPGKLTEATVTHSAAKVRFKLVARQGGEALPDTQWRVKTSNGDLVKTSVGALPTHILAPGTYTVVGISGGETFERDFQVVAGQMVDVEVLKR